MKPETLAALQIAIETNTPGLLWGGPGTGKTTAIENLAKSQGWVMETVIASIREPVDFAGLPFVVDGQVKLAAPDWAHRLSEEVIGDGHGLVFFDELSTATPATQAALLRVVFGRVVGDTKLGPNVRVLAAANEVEQAAGGWDLAAPVANRFCHLEWKIDTDTVVQGLSGHWPDASPLTIQPDWTTNRDRIAPMVAAFLSSRQTHIHAVPEDETKAGKAWPSPRSWDSVIDVLSCWENSGASEDTKAMLVAGLVGEGSGLELLAYMRDLDLPDPNYLLEHPDTFKVPDRDDKTLAIVLSLANAVMSNPTAKRWETSLILFVKIHEAGKKDLSGNGVRLVVPVRPEGAVPPEALKTFIPVLKEIGAWKKNG